MHKLFTVLLLSQLVKNLPARVEGYPWKLVYGSEKHGFTLNSMYRNMAKLDSPVLLVILTTDQQVMKDFMLSHVIETLAQERITP